MNSFRRRAAAMCMSFIMVFATCLVTLPGSSINAFATVTKRLSMDYNLYDSMTDEYSIKVEAGQSVEISAYIEYTYANSNTDYFSSSYLTNLSGDTYTSSVPSVASINSKTGKLTTKKSGTTVVTVKYKGIKTTIKVIVKAKGSLGSGKSTYKNLKKLASKIIASNPGKITSKNRYDISNNLYKLSAMSDKYTSVDYRGFANKKIDGVYQITNELVIPQMYVYVTANEAIVEYVDKYRPIDTEKATSNTFKIKSVSGKKNLVKVTLTRAVTSRDIFAINESTYWDTETTDAKKAGFPIYIKDTKTGHKYYGIATVTKGSKVINIKLVNNTLKKGRKYKLDTKMNFYYDVYDWTKGKTFTAK